MVETSQHTPILFLIFNRPDTTRSVFDVLRLLQPARLFVAADGPRDRHAGDAEKCEQTRRIIGSVDWPCEVKTLFRDRNLGCRKAVSSAIDWFFSQVEEGIILEDDCVPDLSFFPYCRDLLARYRHDSRIMQICGANVFDTWDRGGYSYYFSQYGPIWGWASWRRAWKFYDVDMKLWPEIREQKRYVDFCQHEGESAYRMNLYDRLHRGDIDTWDYQWGFAKMINEGLSVIPSVNLISNIGFGSDATHTGGRSMAYHTMKTHSLQLPIKHPPMILQDRIADRKFVEEFMALPQSGGLIKAIQRIMKGISKG